MSREGDVGAGPIRKLLWIGFWLFLAGILIDQIWHATNEEFETATDQVLAHSVLWVGTLLMLLALLRAVLGGRRNFALGVVLAGTLLYAAVHVWHFFEHLRLRDPDLPHILLVVGAVTMTAGMTWLALADRSTSRRGQAL